MAMAFAEFPMLTILFQYERWKDGAKDIALSRFIGQFSIVSIFLDMITSRVT